MLLPIGLDESRLARWPVVTAALAAACVLTLVAQVAGSNEEEVEGRVRALAAYWAAHPELPAPLALAERTGLDQKRLLAVADLLGADEVEPGPASEARLEALALELAEALDASPERTWGLVPARGLAQPGWLTAPFLHGGLGHLVGNLLVFLLVVAPFLEDAWGRLFFLGLWVVGGAAAGAAQALPDLASHVPIIGASGAISACLGAFALRFAHRRVRMFYWFFLFVRGSFYVPAWAFACFGFTMDMLALSLDGTDAPVAYAAHVGGFLVGVAAALLVRLTGLEDRLAPEGASRWGASLAASRASDRLAAGDVAAARLHLETAVARHGDDETSLLTLARLEASRHDRVRAGELLAKLVARRLQAGDAAGARAAMVELGAAVEPAAFAPPGAYRAAELLAASHPALADRFDEVAAGAGGGLALKALLRRAERCHRMEPDRARDHLERALALDAGMPELRARAEALLARLPAPSERGLELA